MPVRQYLLSSRRCLAFAASALACTLASAQTPRAAEFRADRDPVMQQALEGAVRDLGLQSSLTQHRLSLALVDVTDAQAPRLAMLNGDDMMYAASMPKIGILVGALAEAESGRLPLDEQRLQAMNRMIRNSSNEDATRVLNWVGGDRVLGWLQSDRFHLYDAQSGGGLWVGKGYDSEPAFRRDPVHNLSHGATAFQVARLYTMLADGTLFTPRYNALMMDILSNPGIHHKFVRALDDVPGVRIYRKSGTWKNYHADSALVELDGRRFVMVAIAEDPDGGEWLVRLGRRMYQIAMANGRPVVGLGSVPGADHLLQAGG